MTAKYVLIIDDDINLQQTLALILRKAGYEVFFADSAGKGLQILQTKEIDLVLLDYLIPDMNGTTLLSVVRRLYPALPVLILTGHGSEDLENEMRERRANAYITKPVDPAKILSMVRKLCPLTAAT